MVVNEKKIMESIRKRAVGINSPQKGLVIELTGTGSGTMRFKVIKYTAVERRHSQLRDEFIDKFEINTLENGYISEFWKSAKDISGGYNFKLRDDVLTALID